MRSPADLAAELAEGAASLGLALEPPQEAGLLAYLALLGKWGKVYNLTALRDPQAMLRLHLLDCLALVPPLRRELEARSQRASTPRILDVGSGAGLPGVVLALLNPSWQIVSLDAVAKKTRFVQQVTAELGLPNLHPVHARVEAWQSEGFPIIVSRAFASLVDLVRLTGSLLAENGVWAAMKGRPSGDELASVREVAEVFHVEPLQVPGLDAARSLVWMRRQRNFPSDAALAPRN